MKRDVYPLAINLPGGQRAEYIAGTRPACYTIDGQACDISAEIPDDLAATGWYWSGSFLYQPWPERPDGPGVAISTGTFGMPGTFEAARRMNEKHAEVLALRAVEPAKKPKKRTAVPVEAAPEQMELELV